MNWRRKKKKATKLETICNDVFAVACFYSLYTSKETKRFIKVKFVFKTENDNMEVFQTFHGKQHVSNYIDPFPHIIFKFVFGLELNY